LTDFATAGHSRRVIAVPDVQSRLARAGGEGAEPAGMSTSFEEIYAGHFDFVWRSLRRLGVPVAEVNDATQEVFIVVHRRLQDFEARSALKTWLFGISLRVASDRRRSARRRPEAPLGRDVPAPAFTDPHEAAARAQAVRVLYSLLEELSDEKRQVFVLAELEQMTAPEIAEALSINLNTVYSRLRAARREFDAALTARRDATGARDE